MNRRPQEFEFPKEFYASLRKRPGMYFGCGGSRAIPPMIMQVINAVIEQAPRTHKGTIEVSMQGEVQAIIFHGLRDATFSPGSFARWMSDIGKRIGAKAR